MIRYLICTVVVGLSVGLAFGQNPAAPQVKQGDQPGAGVKNQPQWGKIMKVDGNKIMFQQYDPATKQFSKDREMTVTPDQLKVFQYGIDNKQTPLQGGLKADPFSTLGKDGAYVRLGMTGTNVGQIYLYGNQNAFNKGIETFLKTPAPGSTPGGGK